MSDFLSRLAARAVGQPAAARPRLPGLFDPRAAAGDDRFEIVEEEVVATRPEPPREAAPGERPHTPTAAPAAVPRAAKTAAPASAGEPARFAAEPHEVPRSIPGEQALERRAGPLEAALLEPGPAGSASAEAPPQPLVAAAPATSLVQAVGAREPLPSARTGVAHGDGPAVRVHIGRLEVRANLQQTAPEPPRRREQRADGLSLSDYLRGRREPA